MAAIEPALTGGEPIAIGGRRKLDLSRVGFAEKAGFVGVALITLIALLAPLLAPHDPTSSVGPAFEPPGGSFLLGTDDVGRDILSRILYGTRTSWFSALAVVGVGALIGLVVGLIAGIRGGWLDTVLMRITDCGPGAARAGDRDCGRGRARPEPLSHPARGDDRVVALVRADHPRRDPRRRRPPAFRRRPARGRRWRSGSPFATCCRA